MSEVEDPNRERWSSRLAFYFAAIGAAVGFGNVWRFPSLAKDYGGGAFFVPYLMALFFIGIPILILEISLGQYYQTSDIGVFGTFHPRWKGVGLTSVVCAYMLVTYYSVLISWVTHAFFDSFGNDHPWAKDGTTGDEAIDYFFNKIIGMETVGDDGRPTRVIGANVGFSALVWFVVWLCLAFGAKWTGRITYFTMGFPILLLFIFLIRAVTLDGSSDGIEEYIGKWEMDVLSDRADVWSTAVSQIFFSIGITFGTMTAFGSYLPRNEPATLNSFVIALSNSCFSFIAGFAVFASLGHLALKEGVSVNDLSYGGFSLVFGTWPVVLGGLSGGIHWVRLLFLNLFLLGIDSNFALLEGPLTAILDSVYFKNTSRAKMSALLCFIAWGLSIIYCTDAGLSFLDAIDFYINFVMLLIGCFETFAAGWIYGIQSQVETYGLNAVFAHFVANFGSVIIASGLWFGISDAGVAVWVGFIALVVLYLIGMGVTIFYLNQRSQENVEKLGSYNAMLVDFMYGNVLKLRAELSSVVGFLPVAWAIAMKQFLPQVILILFINLATSDNGSGEPLLGNYGNYPTWPYQVIGILIIVFTAFMFLIGLVAPRVYSGLAVVEIPNLDGNKEEPMKEEPLKEEPPKEGPIEGPKKDENFEYEA